MKELIEIITKNQTIKTFELYEATMSLVEENGWDALLKEAYAILSCEELKPFWYDATSVLFYAFSDGVQSPVPDNEMIARLYWCLSKYSDLGYGEMGFNLVWSTVVAIKAISYNSDWQPLEDNEIKEMIDSFNIN